MENHFLNYFLIASSSIFPYFTVINNATTYIFACGTFGILEIQTLLPGGLSLVQPK